jgi:cytochrome b561
MESFNDLLTKWQPFFTAVAGVAATLAGLLFVALSINRDKVTAQKSRAWLRAAERSFADFIYVLFIALMFLIPAHETYSLGIPLTCLGTFWGFRLFRSLRRFARDTGDSPMPVSRFREYGLQMLSFACFIGACIEVYRGALFVTFYLVPVIAMLISNGSRNAWALLIMENAPATEPKRS